MITIIILICVVVVWLTSGLYLYHKYRSDVDSLKNELSNVRVAYNDSVFENCILQEKIEKIKSLNLIDYNNNDYYKELLTINNNK